MPTPRNAINNAVDTLGWNHKKVGTRRVNSKVYTYWRSEVEDMIKAKGWSSKKEPGAKTYAEFLSQCIELKSFPVGARTLCGQDESDTNRAHQKALNELMLDCFKKVRESAQSKKRAVAQEELDAEPDDPVAEGSADSGRRRAKRQKYDEGHAVVMYILDPGNAAHRDPITGQWLWDLHGLKKLAVIYEPSINELHLKLSANIPSGRKVREIIGALQNVNDQGVLSDVARIQSDEDLDAFLRLTEAKPIKLLAILHKVPADGANTPPPADVNLNNHYFKLTRFDAPEYYQDPLEDSEVEVSKRAGGGRRLVPRKDHTFEDRLSDIRRRIQRQQDMLRSLEQKHKLLFAKAIHDSDPGGDLRFQCYGSNDNLSGKEVIMFRQVVVAYLADLAATTAANATAALPLSDDELKVNAINKVKADLDADVYPGLPVSAPVT